MYIYPSVGFRWIFISKMFLEGEQSFYISDCDVSNAKLLFEQMEALLRPIDVIKSVELCKPSDFSILEINIMNELSDTPERDVINEDDLKLPCDFSVCEEGDIEVICIDLHLHIGHMIVI